MSASEAYISVSLSPEPSADNYSRPFSRTRSHQSCQSARLEPEELSLGPSQNGARQGQALCSISLLIPVHLSFPSTTYPLLPPGPPTLSLLNFTPGLTPISRTTSALTLIHFQSCGVVGWMEIDDSIFGMKLKSPFGIDSPLLPCRLSSRVPTLPPPLPPTSRYLRPGLLSTANFFACMETWARWPP